MNKFFVENFFCLNFSFGFLGIVIRSVQVRIIMVGLGENVIVRSGKVQGEFGSDVVVCRVLNYVLKF